MRWLDILEHRLHWIAFPGLFKYLTILGVIVFAWQWVDPNIAGSIAFDRAKILSGEVWRVFSFAFATRSFAFSPIGVLFLFFAVMISFLISDSLEEAWGPVRTTLYIIIGWLGLVIGLFILNPPPLLAGTYLFTSLFLAFCTLFPKYEFRLFMILPIQVRWLGWLALAGMLFSVLGNPLMLAVVVPTLIPYALWVLPGALAGKKALADAARRRQKFTLSQGPAGEAFHTCTACHRTEHSDPDLEFRVMPDGAEYCLEHLPVPDRPADSA